MTEIIYHLRKIYDTVIDMGEEDSFGTLAEVEASIAADYEYAQQLTCEGGETPATVELLSDAATDPAIRRLVWTFTDGSGLIQTDVFRIAVANDDQIAVYRQDQAEKAEWAASSRRDVCRA